MKARCFIQVLRALDTVEDDMEAYKGREAEKQEELIAFGERRLTDLKCSIRGRALQWRA